METTTIMLNETNTYDYNFTNGSHSTIGIDDVGDAGQGRPVSFADFTEFKVAKFINDYYLYVVCAIGIPGNIACIMTLVFMRPFLSSAIYMLALAIADLIALQLKITYLRLTADDVQLGDVMCRLIFMMGTLWQMYANWVLVALTIERFIAIWFPLNVRELCTKRNTVIVLIMMLVFFTLANIQFLFTYEEVADDLMVWDCRPKLEFAAFIQNVWYWIDGVLYALIPIVLLVLFNSLIIIRVRKSSRKQRVMTHGHRKASDSTNQQRQITTMLLTSSIIFIVLVLPNSVFFITKQYWTWRETPLGIAQYYLVMQIIFLLSDLSHALNFYLYCLSGRKFRQKFLQIICPCRAKYRSGRQNGTMSCSGNDITSSSFVSTVSAISMSPAVTPMKRSYTNGVNGKFKPINCIDQSSMETH